MSNPQPPSDEVLALLADRLLDSRLLGADDLRDVGVPRRIGRFEVELPLGRGSHGSVYQARDPRTDQPVAVKLLTANASANAEVVAKELRHAAAVEHSNLVRVLEVGVDPQGPFLVMEYVDQPPLSERELPLANGAWVLEQVARACHAAHEAGRIHGNLHAGNVLVGKRVLLLDLGIAQALEPTRAGEAEVLADVRALGTMLREQLCVHEPEVVPPELERAALRALAERPKDGFRSAWAFADALRRQREGRRWLQPSSWWVALVLTLLGAALGAVLALGGPR